MIRIYRINRVRYQLIISFCKKIENSLYEKGSLTMERALDSLSCALIRDFSLPVTDPNWRNIISPSAWALTTSNIYKDYLKLTGDGRFCGSFRGFVFMYGFISPSAWALTTSNIYKDYLKLTGDGRFCGNFRGFVFMYGYICDLYNLRDLPENV